MYIEPTLKDVIRKFNTPIHDALCLASAPKANFLAAYITEDKKVEFSTLPSHSSSPIPWAREATGRQPVRFAAFIRKVVPSISEDAARILLEQVTAEFLTASNAEFRVVSGEELRKAYHYKNYYAEAGNLRSCMSHAEQQQNLDFYVYNPDTIQLVVAFKDDGDKKDRVAGRALIYHAAKTEKDAKERKNMYKLLGRVYGYDGNLRTALQNWGRENCDYLVSEGQSTNVKTNVTGYQVWYVPLEHHNLNYYPWIDNGFRTILMESKTLCNRDGNRNEHYMGAHHGSFTDSKGDNLPRLDPFRPDQVYSRQKGKWLKGAHLYIWHDRTKDWVKKSAITDCPVCSTEFIKTDGYIIDGNIMICRNHKLFVCARSKNYFLVEDGEQCLNCKKITVAKKHIKEGEEFYCNQCTKARVTCVVCKTEVFKSQKLYGDGGSLCYTCIENKESSGIVYHQYCGYYSLNQYCNRCHVDLSPPKPKPVRAKAKAVGDPVLADSSGEIPISPRALKFVDAIEEQL